jgi:hypothetical protein
LIAHQPSHGEQPCSAETGAYCKARKRLPEKFFSDVARHAGTALDSQVEGKWLWKGRRVYVYGGSTVNRHIAIDGKAVRRSYDKLTMKACCTW